MSQAVTQLSQSYQQPTKWQISFPRISNTVFYCTSVSVPGFTITETKQPTPVQDLWIPGNKVNYEPLMLTFLVDDKFASWFDVYQWMTGLGAPQNDQQYADLASNSIKNGVPTFGVRPPYAEGILNLYTAKNNVGLQFYFADCYPFTLSSVKMSYEQSADYVLTAEVGFRYSYYAFSTTS